MRDKNRLPRIERPHAVKVHEDENQHLWAVSYADFLMALLSFFILFFSIDTPKRQELILTIANQLNSASTPGDGSGVAGSGSTGGSSTTSSTNAGSNSKSGRGIASDCSSSSGSVTAKEGALGNCVIPNLIEVLSTANYELSQEEDHLLLHFPDDLFAPGEFELSAHAKGMIVEFLNKIEPHKNAVSLYFVGHADQSPVLHPKNKIVDDNFVLSSLRASSALALARQHGYAEKSLFTQAASSNLRNSRSLSVRIEMKEKTP